jgi:hypothetical protein
MVQLPVATGVYIDLPISQFSEYDDPTSGENRVNPEGFPGGISSRTCQKPGLPGTREYLKPGPMKEFISS